MARTLALIGLATTFGLLAGAEAMLLLALGLAVTSLDLHGSVPGREPQFELERNSLSAPAAKTTPHRQS